MKASEAKRLGEELLQEPVKRVNNLAKLLASIGATGDEVCALKVGNQTCKRFCKRRRLSD